LVALPTAALVLKDAAFQMRNPQWHGATHRGATMRLLTLVTTITSLLAFMLGANAADLGRIVRKEPAPPVPAAYSWSGFYDGIHGGGSWAENEFIDLIGGRSAAKFTAHGYFGGGQVGYNWQTGQ
jgi:outer membrane immunogenic protein